MAFDCQLLVFLLGITMFHSCITYSIALSDTESLLAFKNSLQGSNQALSSWNTSTKPCKGNYANWAGVLCANGAVWGLQLENMGLKGTIDVDSLKEMSSLRTLSFMNNVFEGPMPNIKKLGALKSVYFSFNHFSGEIPDDAFEGMLSLKKLHLAQNQFSGPIPSSLATLPRLLEGRLERNKFSGTIPDFHFQELQVLNVADNSLEGSIPPSLAKMKPQWFSGNKGLCGAPLSNPCSNSTSSPPPPSSSSSGKSPTLTAIIAAIIIGIVLIIIAVLICCLLRRKKNSSSIESPAAAPTPSNLQKKASIKDESINSNHSRQGSPEHPGKKAESMRLSFVREDRERFDLQDLLKASAEILGSGCFGSSYKAALTSGTVMVVKRYRQMNNVGREEFQEHMRRLGRLDHPNLLPLVAYYYRKEEKLLVADYVKKGSLAVQLHSNHARGRPALDWPTRLKIVKGVARGLAYLYTELPSLITPHGHLKSSNVLLGDSFEPLLTDYALVPVINQENSQHLMVAYKSPEYLQTARVTKKTDVWSLGILILEILTGKFPANFLQQGGGQSGGTEEEDLAMWVSKLVQVGNTKEVLDEEMKGTSNAESEMMKLLEIGLSCSLGDVEKRLDLKEAVERIEQVKEKDNSDNDEFYSSYASEADIRSSRGLSDELSFAI